MYIADNYFCSLASLLALCFESMSPQEALSDLTSSADSSEAEEEEFHITGTESRDEIQTYDQETEFTDGEIQYLYDGGTLEPVASDPDVAAGNLEEITGWLPVCRVKNTDWCECCYGPSM